MVLTDTRRRRRASPEPELAVPVSELKAEMFQALSNPARIRILEVLSSAEQSVGEMQPAIGIELSHLSQQLGVLRRAGLVTSRKDGQMVFYSLKHPLISELLRVAKQLLISSLTETRDLLADLDSETSR